MQLSQTAVNALDWVVTGLAGVLFSSGVIGAAYTLAYSSTSRRPAAKEFNYLWTSRFLSQVIAALLALSLLLRLQVLWGPQSLVIAGGYHPATLCRVFTALTFGLLEPAFLLLALFSCVYSVQGQKFSAHPNSNIVFFSLGFSLPTCALQLVCALFTCIISVDGVGWLYHTFFATYTSENDHCPSETYTSAGATTPVIAIAPNCAFCTFALFSTLISVAFALCFLLVAGLVTQRIIKTVINKVLVRRIRTLQLLVAVLFPLSVACRGLTVIFQPFDLGFELLRLGQVICLTGTVLSISFILVLKPVHDAYITDTLLKLYHSQPGSADTPDAAVAHSMAERPVMQLLEASRDSLQRDGPQQRSISSRGSVLPPQAEAQDQSLGAVTPRPAKEQPLKGIHKSPEHTPLVLKA